MPLRILLADDSALARQKLVDLLAKESDCAVVGEAANGIEVVQALEEGGVDLLRQIQASLEARLDPRCFVRIHQSTLVALPAIERLQPWFHGDQVVFPKDGTRLALSRNYRKNIPEL